MDGDHVRCLVRPEHVMLSTGGWKSNGLDATVIDKVFVGEAMEISTALSSGERITARRTAREA